VARGDRVRPVQVKKMSAQTLARAGHKNFRDGKVICVPGTANRLLVFAPRILPRSVARKLVKRYNSTKK
jgi:short-subunit dehydrogenase